MTDQETTVEWPAPADDPDTEPSHPGAEDDEPEADTDT